MQAMILYLEDHVSTADFVKKILEHHDLSYVHVRTLHEFEIKMFDMSCDVILTNSVIQERDMFSFTAYIKRKKSCDVPVIAYTGENFVDNVMRASQAGVAYFMVKPFTPSELVYALEKLHSDVISVQKPILLKKIKAQKKGFSVIIEQALRTYFEAHQGALPPSGLYERVLNEIERPLIEMSLEYNKGNRFKTAELLGINRNTLRKKILSLGLGDDK